MIGYPKDTLAAAEKRLLQLVDVGFTPFAMLWRPDNSAQEKHMPGPEWHAFKRRWMRPAIIHSRAA
jgi:hypothetical protein